MKRRTPYRSATGRCVPRSKAGVSALEVAVTAFLMIVVAALAMDISIILLGMSFNDSACRDACRAAAQQPNSVSAVLAAQTQLSVHTTDGYLVSQPTLTSSSSPYFIYNDYSGSPPTNQSPYVKVTTTVTVRLPAPLFFFGTRFMKNGSIQFSRYYIYPIIHEHFYG